MIDIVDFVIVFRVVKNHFVQWHGYIIEHVLELF
jgi:hypothetical protein